MGESGGRQACILEINDKEYSTNGIRGVLTCSARYGPSFSDAALSGGVQFEVVAPGIATLLGVDSETHLI